MYTLTSFRLARKDTIHHSAARWAPDFADGWDAAVWAAPIDGNRQAIMLRNFGDDPLPKYRTYLLEIHRGRWDEIQDYLQFYDGKDISLACWCPDTKIARRQIAEFGTFHCHLGVVATVLDGAGVDWQYGKTHYDGMIGARDV